MPPYSSNPRLPVRDIGTRTEAAGFSLSGGTVAVLPAFSSGARWPIVPNVDLFYEGERGWLEWCSPYPHQVIQSRPAGGCLASFLRLASARDEAIRDYARAWGQLGRELCDAAMPGAHSAPDPRLQVERRAAAPVGMSHVHAFIGRSFPSNYDFSPRARPTQLSWEPIQAWRITARRMIALLDVATALAERPLGQISPEMWAAMFADTPDGASAVPAETRHLWAEIPHLRERDDELMHLPAYLDFREAWFRSAIQLAVPTAASPPEHKRGAVAFYLARWLAWGHASFLPRWTLEQPAPVLALTLEPERRLREVEARPSSPLAGVLAVELAATLTSPLGLFHCDECGLPYTPTKRRPRADRARYCALCSAGASLAAKRAYHRRLMQKRAAPNVSLADR